MERRPDCIAVGSEGRAVAFDRVVEYLWYDVRGRSVKILLDVFGENRDGEARHIRLLHRGGIGASDQTCTIVPTEVHTQRLLRLHNEMAVDPLVLVRDGERTTVVFHSLGQSGEVASRCYRRIDFRLDTTPCRGGESAGDVPFTIWELGPFQPREPFVLRMSMLLQGATYDRQVQDDGSFYVCGATTLVELIRAEDLARCGMEVGEEWRRELDEFVERWLTCPEVYEIVIMGDQDIALPARVNGLTRWVDRMEVPADMEPNTIWLTVRRSPEFEVRGQVLVYVVPNRSGT